MDTNIQLSYQEKALELLKKDAEKIAQLIKVQMDNLMMPQCPLYEEVLDTQMFGLSREIDFAVKLGLLERVKEKRLLPLLKKKCLFYMRSIQKNNKTQTNYLFEFFFYPKK